MRHFISENHSFGEQLFHQQSGEIYRFLRDDHIDTMALRHYWLAIFILVLPVSLWAAIQPKPVYPGVPINSSKSVPKSRERTFTACMESVAYDPTNMTVNLSLQPGGNHLDSLPNLTRLQVELDELGWDRVFVVKTETWGYVRDDFIYRTYYQVQDLQDTSANVRRSPNGEVITAVPNGTEVRFLGIEGSWTQVQLDSGETGYISTQLLSDPNCF